MHGDSETTDIDKGSTALQSKDFKTLSINFSPEKNANSSEKKSEWYITPAAVNLVHYVSLFIIGIISWGLLFIMFGDGWRWDGAWFRLTAVAVTAWATGQILEALTGLPPLLAALLVGIFARNLNILDMREFTHIDGFLRKIYPVVILGKATLGWNLKFMKSNWLQVTSLGVLPWLFEVATLAVFTHFVFNFPWTWGFLLGSVYASLSFAVVMPPVMRIGAGKGRNWAQLVCTTGGIDTLLSVGVFGLIHSFMFVDAHNVYRCIKAALTLVVGVAMGVTWGMVAGRGPHVLDPYVTELRVLYVLLGGLLANFFTSYVGWGGTGGVAVMVCNATAAHYWAREGWPLNKNPASTAYRVLWSALEPALFAHTGTYFVMNVEASRTLLYGLVLLVICLIVRLTVTALVCTDMSLKERVFVCCTWIPKSIVEAVLCPVALTTVMMLPDREHELEYAENVIRLIIEAILITTPIGYLLTNYMGPWLLRKPQNHTVNDADVCTTPTSTTAQTETPREVACL